MPARPSDDTLELDIVAIRPDGDGEARLGRQSVAVPFTIPGERVLVRFADRGPEPSAELLEVLTPSPDRVRPQCRHFGTGNGTPACGGCTWQHIDYPRQLQLKQALVQDALRSAMRHPPRIAPTLGLPPEDQWGFRQKVHFAFAQAPGRDRPVMGHYARGSRRVIPITECPVHAESGNAAAFRLVAQARGAHLGLRGLLARVSRATGRVMATLITDGPPGRALRTLTKQSLLKDPAIVSVSVSAHSGRGSLILGDETRIVSGENRLTEIINGTTYLISPAAFFQTNSAAAALLVEEVLAAVPPHLPVLDLYCGGGLFALALARRGQPVIGIEANRTAIADAVASRQANTIPGQRCRFIAAPVEAAVKSVDPAAARVVVLDPPRAGASPQVLGHVARHLKPEVLVYVSCDPESLARDLEVLERLGYMASVARPIDMFPHTPDVETVAVAAPAAAGRAWA